MTHARQGEQLETLSECQSLCGGAPVVVVLVAVGVASVVVAAAAAFAALLFRRYGFFRVRCRPFPAQLNRKGLRAGRAGTDGNRIRSDPYCTKANKFLDSGALFILFGAAACRRRNVFCNGVVVVLVAVLGNVIERRNGLIVRGGRSVIRL
jgi:hypothetical protein